MTGLLAVGDTSTPLRSLIYLAISQREDGGFYQNFWLRPKEVAAHSRTNVPARKERGKESTTVG